MNTSMPLSQKENGYNLMYNNLIHKQKHKSMICKLKYKRN